MSYLKKKKCINGLNITKDNPIISMTETIQQQETIPQQEGIQRGNKLYLIKKMPDESREIYLERANFIINILTSNSDLTFDNAVIKSYLWRNIKFEKMVYSDDIMKEFVI
jgi:hypothetical protein